jgi:hypothetical protein
LLLAEKKGSLVETPLSKPQGMYRYRNYCIEIPNLVCIPVKPCLNKTLQYPPSKKTA